MKKLFLTSGIILCMACPALATTDIDYDNQTGQYSAANYSNGPTCVQDITGQEADNSDAAFEARWTPVTYQISFAGGTASNNGHSHNVTATTMGNQDAVFDTDVTLNANTYAVTGYRFNQWSCTGNNTSGTSVTNTYADQAHINPFQYISTLACTATWTPETYNVIYNKGAGAGSNYQHTNGATYDGAYTIPAGASAAATPQPGYIFMGWSTDSNPTVTRTARTNETGAINTGTVTNAWTGTSQWTENSAKTVYAAYMPMQYNITYAAGDSNNSAAGGTAATGSTAATYAQYGSSATLATNAFTLTGYGFNGWSCQSTDGSVQGTFTYTDGQTVNPWNVASNLTCTAQWAAGTTAVTYSCGSGTGVSGTEPSGDTATYDSSYTFAANSGSCAKTGYTFGGWDCTGISGTKTAGSSMTWNYTGTTTICTAHYDANTINLTWYDDTGANGTVMTVEQSARSCLYDGVIDIPDNEPTKTGYTFEGWKVRAASNNQNP